MRALLRSARKQCRRANRRFWESDTVIWAQRQLRGIPYCCHIGASREFSLFTKEDDTEMLRYSHGGRLYRSERNYWPNSKKACAVLQFQWTPKKEKLRPYAYHAVFVERNRLLHSCSLHPGLSRSKTTTVMWPARSHLLSEAVRPAVEAAISPRYLHATHVHRLCVFVAGCIGLEPEADDLALGDLDSLQLIGVDTAFEGDLDYDARRNLQHILPRPREINPPL